MCSGTHIKRRKEGPDGPSQRKTKIIKKEEEKDDKALAPYLVGEKKKKEAECLSFVLFGGFSTKFMIYEDPTVQT
jgi:hypothetical protein